MTGFGAIFVAELRDLARHPLVWTGAIAVAAAAWLFGRHAPFSENGYVVYESALQAAAKIAGFFLLGIAAISVAGERARGTVRWILPRPISRISFVLGKGAALAVLALFFLAVGVGVALPMANGAGFGDVVAEQEASGEEEGFEFFEEPVVEPEFSAASMRRRLLLATLLVLPALLTASSIGLLVSSLLRSAAAAVIVSIAVALPLNYLPEVIGLSPETARVMPFRASSDYLDQLLQFGRRLATAEWPEYGLAGVAGALVAAVGIPVFAAFAFARLDITD